MPTYWQLSYNTCSANGCRCLQPNCEKKCFRAEIRECQVSVASPISLFRYHVIMSDLLVSVKRTEDSLLKLKKSRKSNVPAPSGGMSDDNKIRLQIALDIEEYSSQVT